MGQAWGSGPRWLWAFPSKGTFQDSLAAWDMEASGWVLALSLGHDSGLELPPQGSGQGLETPPQGSGQGLETPASAPSRPATRRVWEWLEGPSPEPGVVPLRGPLP